jgi:hypothetical protein
MTIGGNWRMMKSKVHQDRVGGYHIFNIETVPSCHHSVSASSPQVKTILSLERITGSSHSVAYSGFLLIRRQEWPTRTCCGV